ncbi:hypothetical protein HMPREF0281_01246 [Corynebacterium ammoniagenes DSM 20306]|uniref:Uncharacterized protein n=1 Tax=Corynebacterium ammoniagenes DSM 20306 TaxID=649754 RepID=A0ABN0AFE4_CORAM|nr:hypothetical protein HMPREF0281_01246 [Corynebacterium ammoniagenes DSM 20306]
MASGGLFVFNGGIYLAVDNLTLCVTSHQSCPQVFVSGLFNELWHLNDEF